MTKQDYIKHWINTAEKDWEVARFLFEGNKCTYALFLAHLTLEKLAKALWVKNSVSNDPPKIHNIASILKQANIDISEEQRIFFLQMNDFHLEGRYPDYRDILYKNYDKPKTEKILDNVLIHKQWLLNKLQ